MTMDPSQKRPIAFYELPPSASSSATSLAAPDTYYPVYDPLPLYLIPPHARTWNLFNRSLRQLSACAVLIVTVVFLLSSSGSRQPVASGVSGLRFVQQTLYPSQIQCRDDVNWTATDGDGDREYSYYAKTSFALPIAEADELQFFAEGVLSQGVFTVSQTLNASTEEAVVDLDVAYRHPEALADATVCRTHWQAAEGESKWGVGISTSRWAPESYRAERMLNFHIHLHLPAADSLRIGKLNTDLPRFEHRLPDLASSVYFDAVKLKSANAPIHAESLSGRTMMMMSVNGAIRASFKTPTELDLETSNAPIDVRATLASDGGNATRVHMKTTNGRIDGVITLLPGSLPNSTFAEPDPTAPESRFGFGFAGHVHRVVARTTNGPLHIAFADPDVGEPVVAGGARHILFATARTSNAPARVALPPSFEGTFGLASSAFFRPAVDAGARIVRTEAAVSANGPSVRGHVLSAESSAPATYSAESESEFEFESEFDADADGVQYRPVHLVAQHPEGGSRRTSVVKCKAFDHVSVQTTNAPLTLVL